MLWQKLPLQLKRSEEAIKSNFWFVFLLIDDPDIVQDCSYFDDLSVRLHLKVLQCLLKMFECLLIVIEHSVIGSKTAMVDPFLVEIGWMFDKACL